MQIIIRFGKEEAVDNPVVMARSSLGGGAIFKGRETNKFEGAKQV